MKVYRLKTIILNTYYIYLFYVSYKCTSRNLLIFFYLHQALGDVRVVICLLGSLSVLTVVTTLLPMPSCHWLRLYYADPKGKRTSNNLHRSKCWKSFGPLRSTLTREVLGAESKNTLEVPVFLHNVTYIILQTKER